MDFVASLKANNLKVTPQRLTIIEELYKNGHMNIDELYVNLKKKFPSISLATIYKNINSMIDILYVSEVKIPNKKSVYELTKEEHSHLVCNKCNSILDIDLNLSTIKDEASKKSGFNLAKSSVVFTGLCPKCQ